MLWISKDLGEWGKTEGYMSQLIGDEVKRRKQSRNALAYSLKLLGWTNGEIGLVVGLDESAVRKNRKNFNTKLFQDEYENGLTPEKIATEHSLIIRLSRLGRTQQEIADHTDVTVDRSAISKIVKKVDTDKINNL